MADALIVACPECEKKFKPKTDVRGKKIKCPFCKEPFVVPAAKDDDAEDAAFEAMKAGDASPDQVGVAAAAPPEEDEFSNNPDPYGVKHVDLVPRCPNCTTEMGPHDIICLACGYNTLTRSWGKTEKIARLTGGRHFMYLLPALGAAAFLFFAVFFLLFYTTVGPFLLDGTFLFWLDSESMRMWTTVIVLGWVFGAGGYCFKRFIEKPKPDDIMID